MQADNYFLYDQLRRTVRCLRDRLTQAEERLHDLVVGTGGRGQLMQAGGDTYSHLLQTMEYMHLQLAQMARHVYFSLIQEEGCIQHQPRLQAAEQAHRQLLLAAERIYHALIQVAEQVHCQQPQADGRAIE